MLCGHIAKVLDELYVSVDDMGASEIVPDAVLTFDDHEPDETMQICIKEHKSHIKPAT